MSKLRKAVKPPEAIAYEPNTVATVDERTPTLIVDSIEAQGRIVAQALSRLSALQEVEARTMRR